MSKDLEEKVSIYKMNVNPLYKNMDVYLYFIDGLLVDTGTRLQNKKLKKYFNSLPIEQVAITHFHNDHSGMASWLEKHKGVPIYCHERTISILEHRNSLPLFERLFSTRFNGEPYKEKITTSKYELYPVHTPGHTSDHVSLYEPNEGWLFTGDLYVTPYPKVFLKEESISQYIDSLSLLKSFDFHTVFCGHEGVIKNGKVMLKRKLKYLQKLRAEVIRLHTLGYSDRAILKKVLPERVRLELFTLGSFSRLNLIRSCYKE